jgi:hypothetical protein
MAKAQIKFKNLRIQLLNLMPKILAGLSFFSTLSPLTTSSRFIMAFYTIVFFSLFKIFYDISCSEVSFLPRVPNYFLRIFESA